MGNKENTQKKVVSTKDKKKKQEQLERLRKEKERYYGFYDDVKTFARDNGEW